MVSIPGRCLSLYPRVQTGSGPIQSHVQWVPGALFLGVKRLNREAEAKNAWAFLPFSHTYVFMALCFKLRDSLTFLLSPDRKSPVVSARWGTILKWIFTETGCEFVELAELTQDTIKYGFVWTLCRSFEVYKSKEYLPQISDYHGGRDVGCCLLARDGCCSLQGLP